MTGGGSPRPRRRAAIGAAIALAATAALATVSCATDQAMRQAAGWTEIGNAWAELGRWDKAGDAWSRATALDPGQGVASYNLARALAEAGKYDEAIARSDDYLESDPDNAAVLSVKAYALHKSGRDEAAITVYERVVDLNGGDSASVFNLAALMEKVGRTDEALARYDAILKLKPEDPAASYRKGLLLAAAGDAAGAVPFLERYVAANADSKAGRLELALAQERAGLYMAAIETYAALTAKDESDASAWFAVARLKLTVAQDGPGGLEALDKALEKGFSDHALAIELVEARGLASPDDVRTMIDEAGLLEAESAPAADEAEDTPAEAVPADATAGGGQ